MAISKIVAITAIVGINVFGKKEFTSAVYLTKLLHASDVDAFLPHKLNRAATADKNPVAKANRRKIVEMSINFISDFLKNY